MQWYEWYRDVGWLLSGIFFVLFVSKRKDAANLESRAFDKGEGSDNYWRGRAYEKWQQAENLTGAYAYFCVIAALLWIIALAS